MLESSFRRSSVRARIESNPIAPVLRDYIAYLASRGHSTGPLHQYVFAVEHFGRWVLNRPIDHGAVNRFIRRHLPRCECSKPCPRNVLTVRAALHQLLDMLGRPRHRHVNIGVAGILLREYMDHLQKACGLSPTTIRYRVRYARDLLRCFRIREARDLRCWSAHQINNYVSRVGSRCRPSSGQVLACSIRSFLRFLVLRGFLDRDLAVAVPSFAQWRLGSLPRTVDGDHLQRLVDASDPTTPVGMRDRAVLLCLTELALRAADVAAIRREDVDLRAGILRFRRPKQRDHVEVPMTRSVTSAIGRYLRHARPSCESKALFVKHRAPVGGPLKPIGIRGIVVRRATVAGLAGLVRGTHVIRHTTASTLINAGAPIKQIADLLGHQSVDTTAIYAKLDLLSLRCVALPWPSAEGLEVVS